VNDTQCKDENTLDGSCTWIYKYNDLSTNGICVEKSSEKYSCHDLNRTSQCVSGADLEILIQSQCELYEDHPGKHSCKGSCNKKNLDSECNKDDSCYWLEESSTLIQANVNCVDKVCMLLRK
jgi:hypothetical protein